MTFLTFNANAITEDKVVPTFLGVMDPKTYTLLCNLLQPEKPGEKTYAPIVNTLIAHFSPKPLVIAERFRFHRRNQLEGVSVAVFVAVLKKLAEHCEFGDVLNDTLQDRLVCGLRCKGIQKRLLTESNLTLQRAIELCVFMELAAKEAQQLSSNSKVYKMKTEKQTEMKGPCFRCGKTGHSPVSCWFKDLECRSSGLRCFSIWSGSYLVPHHAQWSREANCVCFQESGREALSIVFGVHKFYQYIFGRKFTLLTDHRPLNAIFGPHHGIPALAANRMQRQHINWPTRGKNTLDHCYTVLTDSYRSVPRAALGNSGHCLVHLIPTYRQKLKSVKPVVKTVKRWTNEAKQELQSCFDCTDWSVFEAGTDSLDELTDTVTSYISFCEDMCVPTKTFCKFSNNKPWFTAKLKKLRHAKKDAYTGKDKGQLTREIRIAKRSYSEKLESRFSANDPASVWKCLQNITNYRRPPLPTEANKDLADDLNAFYCRFENNISTPLIQPSPMFAPITPLESSLTTPPSTQVALTICEKDVYRLFQRQKTRKAPGQTVFSPPVSKHVLTNWLLSLPLSSTDHWRCVSSAFNTIILGILHSKLQNLTIPPAICQWITSFLPGKKQQNNLHDPNQSGFKAAHSTETALLAVSEKLHAARSAKLSSVLIFLDLSAAFDTVNHKTLLSTLKSLGICGTAWKWFATYLEGRSYQVTWRGSTSAPWRLTTGVPQGSVLGPLLFSLYTHSIDTTASARISACLSDISLWMRAHQLKLNPSKTELLVIPATARNLGVTMDNELSFFPHVANVARSCRFLLYNIRRIRPFLSIQAAQVLVQSLVISRLDYCNSLLAGLPLNAIRPLQMIQNAAARLVFNQPKFSHTTPLLRSLHWLPVAARIRFKTLMLAYKAKNGPAPSYLSDLITSRTAPRCLRSSSTARLVPPSLRLREDGMGMFMCAHVYDVALCGDTVKNVALGL
ncbi:hypothetical protein C0J50_18226 [Silurus asotus]|uniref:Reverse transcriptase domain-containing protein n=1 Tax=Silurus asotus TaxID=30991 RepID=A0AAD5ASX1_SILAS|nr:hypothetical protein C0J50_18226 [Silurus asotus]